MKINYKKLFYLTIILIAIIFSIFSVSSNQFAYNYLDNKKVSGDINMTLLEDTFVKYQNSTRDVNLTGRQIQLRNINFDGGSYPCNISRNGTICSNSTGTYIVG